MFVLKEGLLFISLLIKHPLKCTHILSGSLVSVTIPVKTVSAQMLLWHCIKNKPIQHFRLNQIPSTYSTFSSVVRRL